MNQKILEICGILGPIVFTLVVLIMGFVNPDYNHITDYISNLGSAYAQYSFVMNTAGFMLFGILIIIFSISLHKAINKGSVIGPAMLALTGINAVLIGLFPSNTGSIHMTVTTAIFITMISSILFVSLRLKNDKKWKDYYRYSLASFLLVTLFSIILLLGIFYPYKGLIQRIAIGIGIIWIEIIAIKLFRKK